MSNSGGKISLGNLPLQVRKPSLSGLRRKLLLDAAVMGAPPVVTVGGAASALASPVNYPAVIAGAVASGPFRLSGGKITVNAGDGVTVNNQDAAAATTMGGMTVEFELYDSEFEFRQYALVSGNTQKSCFRIWINGQPHTQFYQTFPAYDGARHWVLVNMGAVAKYHVVIEIMGRGAYFGGLNVNATGFVSAPETGPGPLFAIVGDSYGRGDSADTNLPGVVAANALQALPIGYAWIMAAALGFPRTLNASIGGTGFTNAGTATTYQGRITSDVIPAAPDLVMLQGSQNDTGATRAALAASVETAIAAIQAALPDALVFVTGPCFMRNPNNFQTVRLAMQDAATAQNVPMIDPCSVITGTGFQGAVVGDGVADVFCASDGIHPTWPGHRWLGGAMAAAAAPLAGLQPL